MSYAFKKDAKGERHGTPNERLLAEQNRARLTSQNRPNTLFATGAARTLTLSLQAACASPCPAQQTPLFNMLNMLCETNAQLWAVMIGCLTPQVSSSKLSSLQHLLRSCRLVRLTAPSLGRTML